MNNLELYFEPSRHPYLTVPQYVIKRAITHLDKIEALALIRGAYRTKERGHASLDDALTIYDEIRREARLGAS